MTKYIQMPDSDKIDIQALSIKCRCKKCGWLWGAYIKLDGSYPANFDVCNRCKNLEKEGGKQ